MKANATSSLRVRDPAGWFSSRPSGRDWTLSDFKGQCRDGEILVRQIGMILREQQCVVVRIDDANKPSPTSLAFEAVVFESQLVDLGTLLFTPSVSHASHSNTGRLEASAS